MKNQRKMSLKIDDNYWNYGTQTGLSISYNFYEGIINVST